MIERLVLAPRRRATAAASVVLVLASVAAFTRPFTWSANTVVALSYVAVLAFALTRRLSVNGASTATSTLFVDGVPRWRRARAWMAIASASVAWELVCLAGHPRRDHPTLSSILNVLDRTTAARGLFFVAWLALSLVMVSS